MCEFVPLSSAFASFRSRVSGSLDDPDYFLEQHGNRSMGRFLAEARMGPTTLAKGRRSHRRKLCYSPMVRMTLLSGRVLLDDNLSSCASISSYFGTVVTAPFGTMCTTL